LLVRLAEPILSNQFEKLFSESLDKYQTRHQVGKATVQIKQSGKRSILTSMIGLADPQRHQGCCQEERQQVPDGGENQRSVYLNRK